MFKYWRPVRAARVALGIVRVFPRYLVLAARERFGRPAAQDRWDRAHERAASELRDIALELAGAFVKVAQIVGARADVFPQPFVDALSQFHDSVPPRPFEVLQPIVERDLGRGLDEVFAEVDRDPIAAASLAQVHRATLPDRREVVVKIQYPEVRRIFPLDLSLAHWAARLAFVVQSRVDIRSVAEEIVRFISLEIDFVREADSTERLAKVLALDTEVRVPEVYREYCGANTLVLEFLDGIPVARTSALEAAGHSRADVARRIGRLYGEMIFQHGFFHGDPHPGNLLVLPDGRIGLLDFGLCKELPPGFAANVAEMMISSMVGDTASALSAAEALGFEVRSLRPDHLRSLLLTVVGDSDGEEGAIEILGQSRIRRIPEDFALVIRTLILLNGLSHRLVPRRRLLQGELIQTLARGVAAA